jgi:hypothetical protein
LYFKDNVSYLLDLSEKLSSVKPFELACEFMNEDEKILIKEFINKIKDNSNSEILERSNKLLLKFNKFC